jgi:hypothetical protein
MAKKYRGWLSQPLYQKCIPGWLLIQNKQITRKNQD